MYPQKHLHKGLIPTADSCLDSNVFAFQEGARMIFVPQTRVILTSMCIFISIKIQHTSSALEKEAVGDGIMIIKA